MWAQLTALVKRIRSFYRNGAVPAMRRDCGEESFDNHLPKPWG